MTLRLDKSKLLAFWKNPMDFYKVYVLKEQPEVSFYTMQGTFIHDWICNFLKKQPNLKYISLHEDKNIRALQKNFLSYWLFRQKFKNKVMFSEQKFEYKDDKLDVMFVGVVDLIDLIDGECYLIDYKSGKTFQKTAYNIELNFYNFLLEKLGYKIDKLAVYLLGSNKFINIQKFQNFDKWLNDMIKNIRNFLLTYGVDENVL